MTPFPPAPVPELWLMRHGETHWNRLGRLQGALDSPLTRRGREQAAAQARLLAPVLARPGLRRLSSPQGRACQTARIVFGAAGFDTDARLSEIGMGDFTGAFLDDLRRADPALFGAGGLGWYDRVPGGEHLTPLATRLRGFLAGLTGPAVIVTHGVTLQVLRLLALGQDLSQLDALAQEQGAVYHIRDRVHRRLPA
ncbi:histidine phosphatase family protein [Paracoccus jiaweipingae]|uniref:histidine phosphatase family protein n=1 Tax=unclassified Paracoccus (in: a-proteobacteria) TaxID=2688777 RepID=UPI0037966994